MSAVPIASWRTLAALGHCALWVHGQAKSQHMEQQEGIINAKFFSMAI